ncbi:hypothetical protein AC626_17720 [Pseudoalteromonas rubra]|uniref:Uncharacterized protein n=1 Tax=Pseudoalteromonas rubra TaxID=43658 RepID=A0A0L0ER09_9GAMM|nr:hypothetical protein AC626_17720 [Pseudoalteromonas rubra]
MELILSVVFLAFSEFSSLVYATPIFKYMKFIELVALHNETVSLVNTKSRFLQTAIDLKTRGHGGRLLLLK